MGIGRVIEDWNYNNDPANSMVDRVRMLVGDTDPSAKLISDTEVEYLLTESGGEEYEAAWRTACAIKAWAARLVNKSGGGMNEGAAKVFEHYKDLCDELLMRAPMAIPRAPQLRRADRERMKNDPTLIQPQFGTAMLSEDAVAIRPSTQAINPDEVLS